MKAGSGTEGGGGGGGGDTGNAISGLEVAATAGAAGDGGAATSAAAASVFSGVGKAAVGDGGGGGSGVSTAQSGTTASTATGRSCSGRFRGAWAPATVGGGGGGGADAPTAAGAVCWSASARLSPPWCVGSAWRGENTLLEANSMLSLVLGSRPGTGRSMGRNRPVLGLLVTAVQRETSTLLPCKRPGWGLLAAPSWRWWRGREAGDGMVAEEAEEAEEDEEGVEAGIARVGTGECTGGRPCARRANSALGCRRAGPGEHGSWL